MQDSLYRRFFSEPSQTLHRRYEALRAVVVDGQPQTEVAKRFGYTYDSLRRLVSDFRAQCQAGQVPPFSSRRPADALRAGVPNTHWSARTSPPLLIGVSYLSRRDVACVPGSRAFSCSYRS
jgi:Helix-turn-helix domain